MISWFLNNVLLPAPIPIAQSITQLNLEQAKMVKGCFIFKLNSWILLYNAGTEARIFKKKFFPILIPIKLWIDFNKVEINNQLIIGGLRNP